MLNNEFVVWSIFRMVDLLIIMGLSIYAMRRWGLPLIRKQINDEQQGRQDLMQSVDTLHERAQTLDKQLQSDNEHIAKLEHQVRLWQETIKRKQNKRQTEKEDIKIRLEKKYAQRVRGIQEQLAYDAIVPDAIDQAEQQLKKLFDEAKSKAFVDTLLSAMQKEQQ